MTIPPGYSVLQGKPIPPNLVCKLRKSLYGLKQASRQWNIKISGVLLASGFLQSVADTSVFVRRVGSSLVVVLIYVDDILLSGNDSTLIDSTKVTLQSKFEIKDLGPPQYFLGIEISRSSTGIHLCQRKYALELLEEYGLLGSKPVHTPTDLKEKLTHDSGELLYDASFYRQLIGKLIYLSVTRPYICFAVQKLSQFMSSPRSLHLQAAFRVLKYLKSAPSQGLLYSASSSLTLKAYSDADWASCPNTRRSITGYCVFLGNSMVSWKSKKQSTVSRSITESEYRALAQTGCELIWIDSLLKDLHISCQRPFNIYCDNQSTLHLARNLVLYERTKHIRLDCHFIRQHISSGLLQPLHVRSNDQVADLLTKPLVSDQFKFLLSKWSLYKAFLRYTKSIFFPKALCVPLALNVFFKFWKSVLRLQVAAG
ncbi:PREDICTED: uncharacterized protein LOC109116755 [Tarenaya hassleriana]|uniref:uncharacterized protein LOC109116755 n=1 Tax=Tarenaya hassleriana TaxID=28532 RepID=UPI0008FD2768|nr:PREDICTED: uncharacterized protein LOC109116755 [Tarenaya hassleriana]